MTEAEQFISEYLGVPESDFPVSVNLKLLGEAVEAYKQELINRINNLTKYSCSHEGSWDSGTWASMKVDSDGEYLNLDELIENIKEN